MEETSVTVTSARENKVLVDKATTIGGVRSGGELTEREGMRGGARSVVVKKDERSVGRVVGGDEGRVEKAMNGDLGEVAHFR